MVEVFPSGKVKVEEGGGEEGRGGHWASFLVKLFQNKFDCRRAQIGVQLEIGEPDKLGELLFVEERGKEGL